MAILAVGLLVVLFFWAAIGGILAALGALVLGGATAFFTRRVREGRLKAILAATLFPIACLAWAGTVFVFQLVVNETLLSRDPGLGDAWTTPLPNGYALLMIDVTDHGTVYNPKTQSIGDAVTDQEDAVFDVRMLQVAGRYILGAADSQAREHFGENSDHVDSFFLLDTQTNRRTNFSSYDALSDAGLKLGIQPNMERIDVVYTRYRFSWFDAVTLFLLLVPPLISAWLLMRWIVRLRRGANAAVLAA